MGTVVPFAPRASAGGGWTAAEQARLSELADRLAAGGAKVEVVYGMTDEGDPWCVIKDDQEEVLIHVARINGNFVIHDASLDTIQQGETLWSATDRLLGGDWRDNREDVVVSLSARQVQTFIALVVAATFIQQADEAEAATIPPQPDHAAEVPVALVATAAAAQSAAEEPQRQDLLAPQHAGTSEEIVSAAAPAAPLDAAPPEPETGAATPEAVPVEVASIASDPSTPELETQTDAAPIAQGSNLQGDESDDVLTGGAGGDTIEGGAGDDTVHGLAGDDSLAGGSGADQLYGDDGNDTLDGGTAPEGRFDFLDGGAGDDHLHISATTVAQGGEGADTFIFNSRPAPDGFMGAVLDYSGQQGDRLVIDGKDAKVVSQQSQANIFEGRQEHAAGFNITKVQPGVRVGVDLNNDGKEDGYFLLGRPPAELQVEAKVAIIDLGWSEGEDSKALWQAFNHFAANNGDFLA